MAVCLLTEDPCQLYRFDDLPLELSESSPSGTTKLSVIRANHTGKLPYDPTPVLGLDLRLHQRHQIVLRGVAQGNSVLQLCGDEAVLYAKTVQDRHSWFVRGPQRGRNCLDDLSSRPSAA